MVPTNRYVVYWQSSVAGSRYETKPTPASAKRLLEKREQREDFVRGVVVDLAEHTQSGDSITEAHRRAVEARRVA